jgi:uncharacterized protein (UPF0335 family)
MRSLPRTSIDFRAPRGGINRRALRGGGGSTRVASSPKKTREASMANVGGIAGDRLKSFIERIERLEEEKRALAEDVKEIYSEAKGAGFEVKIIRQIVRIRKMDEDDRDEAEALLDTYLRAIGMKPERSGRRAAG